MTPRASMASPRASKAASGESKAVPRKASPRASKAAPRAAKAPQKPTEFPYYVAARPMSRNGESIKVGEVIPDAASWPRLESWLRAGYVKEIS